MGGASQVLHILARLPREDVDGGNRTGAGGDDHLAAARPDGSADHVHTVNRRPLVGVDSDPSAFVGCQSQGGRQLGLAALVEDHIIDVAPEAIGGRRQKSLLGAGECGDSSIGEFGTSGGGLLTRDLVELAAAYVIDAEVVLQMREVDGRLVVSDDGHLVAVLCEEQGGAEAARPVADDDRGTHLSSLGSLGERTGTRRVRFRP